MRMEHAYVFGHSAASVLVDMTKCYEKVVHFFLASAAIKHGFPLHRLRYLLCLYRGQRVLQVGRVCSELVACIQAILAGCTFATTLLKCLLLDPLDQVVSKFPSVRIYNVVDDITCGATGRLGRWRERRPMLLLRGAAIWRNLVS